MTASDKDIERAEEVFVGLSRRDGAGPVERAPVSRRDLAAYFTDPEFHLSDEAWSAIEADPGLRADFDFLSARFGFLGDERFVTAVPRRAAAAGGGGQAVRPFPGGKVRLEPSGTTPSRIVVIIELDNPDPAKAPDRLLMQSEDGRRLRGINLSAPRRSGRIQVIKDLNSPADREFIDLVRDHRASGRLLRIKGASG